MSVGVLLGVSDGRWLRAVISVLDPVMLPLFLELGSLIAFSHVFSARRRRVVMSPA